MNRNQLPVLILLFMLTSCSIPINRNFNYDNVISPKEIKSDINDLTKDLKEKHFDINWEGKESWILGELDKIKQIDQAISLDSFETRLDYVINNIDDGHTRIIRQDSIKSLSRNSFGTSSLTDSILYLRIGSFSNARTDQLIATLSEFGELYDKNKSTKIIVDIRDNGGGLIQNVNRTLSYFLPDNTKLYEKLETKSSTIASKLTSKALSAKQNLKYFKYTSKKKIKGKPEIYLLINENIISGSMLFSYHMQKHGAFVIGKRPKSLFNTFGYAYGHKLKHSRIIYVISTIRLILDKENPTRIEDMITSDLEPDPTWSINELVKFIEERNIDK